MTLLNIVEFRTIQAYPTEESAQIAAANVVTTQEATPTTSSTTCVAFNANTQIVRLCCDTTVGIAFSVIAATALINGIATSQIATANTTSMRLVANLPEYFGVTPGQVLAHILRS